MVSKYSQRPPEIIAEVERRAAAAKAQMDADARAAPKPPPEPPIMEELRALTQRAQNGDPSVLPAIRAALDEHPEITAHLGDLADLTRRSWLSLASRDNPVIAEAMRRQIADMEAELAGSNPTKLEKMLVQDVVICWLQLQCHQRTVADTGGTKLKQAELELRHLEGAQRRYQAAIKMLTTTRQLAPAGLAPAKSIRLYSEPDRASV